MTTLIHEEKEAPTRTITKTEPPEWLLAFWKEIDDKTFGKGFDCFTGDAICSLGVADWHGREQIRENLRAFIDTGFIALDHVADRDGGSLEVFRGTVRMTPDDKSKPVVKPVMASADSRRLKPRHFLILIAQEFLKIHEPLCL